MLLPVLLALAAVWTVGMIATVVHVRLAPEGIEDADGFHVVQEAAPALVAVRRTA